MQIYNLNVFQLLHPSKKEEERFHHTSTIFHLSTYSIANDLFSVLLTLIFIGAVEGHSKGVVWWIQRGLTEVPDIPADALVVRIEFNNITRIPAGSFLHLSECFDLSLSLNSLKYIEPGAFEGLVKLNTLHIMYAALEELKSGMFEGLSSLMNLDLHNNPIRSIESGSFHWSGQSLSSQFIQ